MRKNAIIGLVLGVLIGSGAVYATTINYNISGRIIIPSSTVIELGGIPKDYNGNYYFEDLVLNDAKAKARFMLSNKGSEDAQITYTATTSHPKLSIRLEGYLGGSSYGNQFEISNTATIPRAGELDCELIIEDLGAETGNYDFTITIQING